MVRPLNCDGGLSLYRLDSAHEAARIVAALRPRGISAQAYSMTINPHCGDSIDVPAGFGQVCALFQVLIIWMSIDST